MHLPSLVEIEEADLVAACDLRSERAAVVSSKFGVREPTMHKEMLAAEELDAVCAR